MPQAPKEEEVQPADVASAKFGFKRDYQPPGFVQVRIGMTLVEVENLFIAATFESTRGNVSKAAALLGIDRSTLYEKIRRANLRPQIRAKVGVTADGPEEKIRDLQREKAGLDQAVAILQDLQRSTRADSFVRERSPRGRKSMGPKERQEVSQRMK